MAFGVRFLFPLSQLWSDDDESKIIEQTYETHNRIYEQIRQEISNLRVQSLKFDKRWSRTHIAVGAMAIAVAILDNAFTFSSNQTLNQSLSIASALLAATLTFLNPSRRVFMWREIRASCEELRNDIDMAAVVFDNPNSSNEEKMVKLEELNEKQKKLTRQYFNLLNSIN